MSVNLYTPPLSQAVSQTNTAFTYRSLHTLSHVLTILLVIYACISGGSILAYYLELNVLNSASTTPISYETAQSLQLRQGIVALSQLAALLVTAIPFAMFLMQANRNARALGGNSLHLEYTPGWMVGWFFIPLANLWKPFDAVRQVWTAGTVPLESSYETPSFFTVWWVTWILQGIVTTISTRAFRSTSATVTDLIIANWLDIFSDTLAVVCSITAILVIRSMSQRLEKRQQFVLQQALQR